MPPSTSTTSTPETLIFMASILDQRSPSTDRVFQTSIALSTSPSTTAIEPLPHLNYFLINQLIRLARPLLQKRRLKRFDYVADARKQFYTGHFKFLLAYRDLLDASACAALLDREAETLSRLLADALADARDKVPVASTRERLRTVEMQRRRNNEDMRVRLARLDAKAKRRRYAAAWYSDLKVVFLRDEVPWLIAVGRQRHEEAVARRGM
ncbi:hypothetical protein IMSHALPRED_010819 [Imshaugia aleurites]|uniref:Uncharacterized protein n=1 Tax=Imshaugia aleurites TaxID=172621 RepID=A0A8H3G205_9LECA|nr:hypothetical protein IMSHALPRED_010819 [Imshaugia aleurites]